jgi:membrane protein implicated in regulation of membrane protease activity
MSRRRSENVIINGPMSFAGAWQRSFRLAGKLAPRPARFLTWPLALLIAAAWWALVAIWYVLVFWWAWILIVPYRLLRRGARKRKTEALRHREVMDALERERR